MYVAIMAPFSPAGTALVVTVVFATLSCGPRTQVIEERVEVDDAPNHREAKTLAIEGGTIRFDLGGSHDQNCPGPTPLRGFSCIYLHFYTFPLVKSEWKPSDPVPAWVTCGHTTGPSKSGTRDRSKEDSFEKCEARLRAHKGDVKGPVKIRVEKDTKGNTKESTAGWVNAIQDAERRHDLVAAKHSPVIELVY